MIINHLDYLFCLTSCLSFFVQYIGCGADLKHMELSLQSEDIPLDLGVPSLPRLDSADDPWDTLGSGIAQSLAQCAELGCRVSATFS
jgi:hypothetical protein